MPGDTREQGVSLGVLLRRLREAAGFTQEELAQKAGLTAKAVSALERGERKRPYPHTVRALADALGLSEEERAGLAASVPRRGGSPAAVVSARDVEPRLPGHLDALIGREREAEAALLLLRRPNVCLLTLTGPGGVGKTRLALRVAADANGEFPDGVHFVPLAPLRGSALVTTAVAQALGAREAGGDHPLQNLVATIGDRRMLLVLDNFEHVLEAAPNVTDLLLGCPNLKVLVTSRAPLRIRGEQEYRVPPLELPSEAANEDDLALSPAIRLFVARAQAVMPDFTLNPENAGPLARICARLDGLPLAIELAAARVRLLPPQSLEVRLERGLQVLTGGPRDLPARQRTMRDAIAWSHDLLEAGEKTLFRRLAVFAGGGELDAVEAVCTDEESVLDGLASLLDNSLIRRGAVDGASEPRIGLLEPVRQYAREHLEESGEAKLLAWRHARYYHDLAVEAGPLLMGHDQVPWLDRMWSEQYNLLAAVRFFVDRNDFERAVSLTWALWRYWWVSGLQSEARRWLEELLARKGSDLSPARRAQALLTIGTYAWSEGDLGPAIPALEEGLRLSRDTGDARSQAIGLMLLGLVDAAERNGERSRERFEESLSFFRIAGESEKWGEAHTLAFLGLAPLLKGEHEPARRCFEEGLAASRAAGDRIAAHQALYKLGLLALAARDLDQANEHLREGLSLASEVRDILNAAYLVKSLGHVAGLRGESALALRLLGAAETALRATGSSPYRYIPDQELQDRILEAARAELGETAFEEEWRQGLTLPLERASAEALEVAGP